ncbi:MULTISPECIES: hypothetical protein [Mesoflavibacter]|uniref:Uncharacterized protein n=1 Tax=Mesoflavibacter profundi TaxID=2708110 RepID=A0ABT4RYA1_9FLAO|nr:MULTISPECIES: hypothetical protein [Mesoflavibacter]MDA0176784.1 hypothetical protein [Mesoflavibacter profundi]QIJ90442.1 hypothetical protein C7H62_2634 [Mesoflavibacter sp. HG96]QIJ93170.1 hypothetical protein C7H56_2634 [Mesoflavibacter sp. HG37]
MDFEELLKQIKDELLKVLGESYADYKTESKKDVEAFLEASKEKLERWTKLLANTELTVKDYEWLLKSQKDILVLKALYQAGITKQRLGHLKNKIIDTIVNVVVGAIF